MKKIISVLIAFVLILSLFAFSTSAAGSGSLALSSAEGKQGDTVTVNVNINSNPGLITIKFSVSWGDGLELTSVSDSGLLQGWTSPAPTISSPYTLRWANSLSTTNNTSTGKIATLSFKIRDNATVGNKNVILTFIESRDANGSTNSFSNSTATIKVNCKNHSYSSYTNKDTVSHTRTCSVCGTVETNAHTWNGGETIKTATCKETGEKRFTCTACNATKTEVVAKTNNHTYSAWAQTKAPTCTDKGSESRTCSTCRNTETREIAASGHKFGKWTETKAATCTDKGAKERKCSKCDTVEKDEINPLGHDFKSPVIIKKPTLTEKGIEEGICKRCGEKAQSELPCFFKDEATDVVLSPEYGAFKQGTEIKIEVIKNDNSFYETVKTALGDKSEEFIAYDISAVLNNVNIEPDKPVTVTFKIPDGYGKNVAVFYIKDESDAEKLESTVSEDGSTVSVTLTHFSSYAVAKLSEKASPSAIAKTEKSTDEKPETTKNSAKRNKAIGTIILITVIILLIATAVILYLKKRKSKNQYNEYDLIN